ncbi:hypothetical protein [Methanoculleus sp. UBA208]|uniref:hypothetical protein n=1 Tax=Methanoculleus sp. UBA208 TaxID=1915494 RepID=UPI0025CF7719|nr:hypothetical protein [Methanoculleus sp. UBA208]
MSRLHDIKTRALHLIGVGRDEPTKKTKMKAGGGRDFSLKGHFNAEERTPEKVKALKNIYKKGGIYAEALDQYPLYMFSNGYRLEGDEVLKKKVQARFDQIDIESVLEIMTIEALVTGDGVAENARGKGSLAKEIVAVIPRGAETFRIKVDSSGDVQEYVQQFNQDGIELETPIPLQTEEVTHLRLLPVAGSPYGLSLLGRAIDEVTRDTKTAEATASAIWRHGYPKYDATVTNGPEELEVDEQDLKDVEKELEEIEAKNEFVHDGTVTIKNLDQLGAQHVGEYNDATLVRVCASLGVPEELIGLRRGSTDATAVSRIDAFFKRIKTFQKRVGRTVDASIIDLIVGRPGQVWIVFNDPNPKDFLMKADAVGKVLAPCAQTGDLFAIMGRRQVQEYLDIDPDKWEELEGEGALPTPPAVAGTAPEDPAE